MYVQNKILTHFPEVEVILEVVLLQVVDGAAVVGSPLVILAQECHVLLGDGAVGRVDPHAAAAVRLVLVAVALGRERGVQGLIPEEEKQRNEKCQLP